MERFHLYLKPGERIRTPLVSLMFWNGDNLMTGQNKFRRFLLAHHSRQLDGKFAEYPYASGFALPGPEPCTENGCLTEEMAIAMARRHKQFNLVPEVFWLDAGWYTDSGAPVYDWCDCVGTWTPDTTRFPNGLRPLSDEAHRLGARFLLWFEPERVSRGSWLAREHQPWLLHTPRRNSALLDLGNPEALEWLCTHVGDMIEREGIDIYRQDFNHPPKPFWEDNEQPDRIGMTEIRHIEGLYTYWDYLLSRFPRLLIDNCAARGTAHRPRNPLAQRAVVAHRLPVRRGDRLPEPHLRAQLFPAAARHPECGRPTTTRPFEPRRSGGRHLGPLHAQTQSSRHPARNCELQEIPSLLL